MKEPNKYEFALSLTLMLGGFILTLTSAIFSPVFEMVGLKTVFWAMSLIFYMCSIFCGGKGCQALINNMKGECYKNPSPLFNMQAIYLIIAWVFFMTSFFVTI